MCLTICLPAYLCFYLYDYLAVYIQYLLPFFFSVHPHISPSIYLSMYLSVCLSTCLFLSLSLSLSVRLGFWVSFCLSAPNYLLSPTPSTHLHNILPTCLSALQCICPSKYLLIYQSVFIHLSFCISRLQSVELQVSKYIPIRCVFVSFSCLPTCLSLQQTI